jgi:peptidoglycan-N-acetylglucosamine deacetylase
MLISLRTLVLFLGLSSLVFAELAPVPEKTVILTFDDGVVSHSTVVAPMLKKFGFTATFFVCEFQPDFDDKTKYMSWEQMAQLARDGFEVASHTRSHKHLSKMAPGEFEQELGYIERKFGDLGMPRPSAFAYPAYGTTPDGLRILRERGYRFARIGDSRAYDPKTDDPLLIPSFSTTGTNENAAQRVMAALRQATDGKIVVLTIHGVPDTAHPHVNTSPELFERYLKFLADEKYNVIAMRDLAKYAKPAARTPNTATDRYASRLEKVADADAWRAYFARSDEWRKKQVEILAAEVKAAGRESAAPAPSGGDAKLAPALLDSVLSFQLPSGGWSKSIGYAKGTRTPGMAWTSGDNLWHYAGTFDNRATTGELRFLAASAPSDAVKAAIVRGVDYVLEAQFPNGGWPQNYPLEGGYHDFITLNDSAMLRVLEFLEEVAEGRGGFGFLDAARRERARNALERGDACLLRLQIKGTVWCAQYDPLTLAPAHARLFEPASLSGGESVEVVRRLMRLPKTPERTKAIEAALEWFSSAKTFPPEKDGDKPQWARFYDLKSQQPVFTGKTDGRTYDTYEAMRERNPGGYDYLVNKPADLIGKWAQRWREGK